MMVRFGVLVVVAVLGVTLGGCSAGGDSPDREVAGQTSERTSGQEGGWASGTITGFVTEVAHTSSRHWIDVEEDPCAKISLQILDSTRVLRGQGGDARAAADIEEGQWVRAIPGEDLATSYPLQGQATKVVILGTR